MAMSRITKYPGIMKELDEFLKPRGLRTNGNGSVEDEKTLYLAPEGGYGGSYGPSLGNEILELVAEKFGITKVVLDGIEYKR